MSDNPPLRLLAAYQQEFDKAADVLFPLVERDMWVAADFVEGHRYRVVVPDLESYTQFDRRSAKQNRTTRNRPLPRWARYVTGALLVLSSEGFDMVGCNVLILGDEPAGPRYEHALGMGFAALILRHNKQDYDSKRLLQIMEQAHKEYINIP